MISAKYYEINKEAQTQLSARYNYDTYPSDPVLSSYSKYGLNAYKNIPINYIFLDADGIDLNDDTSLFAEKSDYIGFKGDEFPPYEISETGETIIYEYNKPLTYGFQGFPTPMSIKGITINYSRNLCDYVTMAFYTKDGVKIHESTERTRGMSNYIDVSVDGFGYCTFTFIASVPHQYLKLESIIFGKVETLNKFKSFEIYKEINILSKDLPVSSCDFATVSNDEFNFMPYQDLIVFNNGSIFDYFYVENVERNDKNVFSFDCVDSIGLYDKQEGEGLMLKFTIKKNSFDIENEGVQKSVKSFIAIDDSYIGKTGSGFFGYKNRRFAAMQLAFALGGWIDCNNTTEPIIRPLNETIMHYIGNDSILGKAVLEKQNKPRTVRLHIYNYVKTDDTAEVWRDTTTKAGESKTIDFHAEHTEPMYSYTIEGSGHLDHDQPNINFDSNWISGRLLGCTGDNPTIVKRFKYQKNDTPIIIENEMATNSNEEDWSNYTVSCPEMLDTVIGYIKKWQKSEGIVKARIIIRNGERVGDAVSIQTAYDGVQEGIITKMTILPGYNNIADIEVTQWEVGRG